METIIVVDHHRNEYCGNRRNHGSPVSRDFRGINCRTFQSGAGLLPTPACVTPVRKRGFAYSSSSDVKKTPVLPYVNSLSVERSNRNLKRGTLNKSSSVPVPIDFEVGSGKGRSLFCDEFSYSELWAGPAYSNSPPPSSLPIPKFFVQPKRTVSLDLPASSVSEMKLQPVARSAPPSPKREHNISGRNLFHSADYATATKDLRRILNLDVTDG